jgi:tape measure domain-containing protein
VAAYRADVEIAVKGGRELAAVSKQVAALGKNIADVNKAAKLQGAIPASINNYNTALAQANATIRASAAGTRVQKQAIDLYVTSLAQAEKAERSLAVAVKQRQRELGIKPKVTGAGGGGGGRLGGVTSNAIIGGAFPLLFGQGAGAATGGAIGGAVGGLFGGTGGFAGSLLGTLIGGIASKGQVVKKLGEDIGFSAEQTRLLEGAFKQAGREFDKFEASVQNIRGLSLDIEDQANAIKLVSTLTETFGGEIDKVTNAFTSALESGKVTQATLNQLTSQGIPIQEALAQKYGVSRSTIVAMAKDGKISVQTLSDVLVDMGNKGLQAGEKPRSAFEQFSSALGGTATAVGNVASVLSSVLGPAIDSIILKATQALNILTETINTELLRTDIQSKSGKIVGPEKLKKIEEEAMNIAAMRFPSKAQGNQLAAGAEIISPAAQAEFQILREQGIRNELQKFGFESGILKTPTSTVETIGRIKPPSQLPPSGDGGAAADKAAKDANRIAEQIRTSKLQLALAQDIFAIEGRLQQAQLEGNEQLVLARNAQKELAQIASQRADIIADKEIPALAKKNVLNKLAIDAATVSGKLGFDLAKIEQDRTESFDVIIADLNLELELKTATTEQAREQLRLEAEIAKIRGDKSLTDSQKDEIERRKRELAAPKTEGQKINAELGAVEDELKTLVSLSNQVTSAANAIGTAFGNSFKGLISGSMTAKEALASFFSSVADHFLDMAAQIIAKMIQMFILQQALKIFGGAFSGGLSSAVDTGAQGWADSFATPLPGLGSIGSIGFAEGGFVTGPTNAIIGEGGESEYVIPSSKMNAAMSRYSRGARGEGVIAGSGGGGTEGESGAAAAGPIVVDVRYSVERINDVEYVTSSQFQAGLRQAAQQGAAQGEQRTLRRLQQSPSTRKRVGV